MKPFVIGVDPGQTTGICVLDGAYRDLVQTTPGLVLPIVRSVLFVAPDSVLAVEKFVVGPRASRLSTPKAGQTTRELIGALVDLGNRLGVRVVQRSASDVKPWATDVRLKAAGIWTKGMPHAHDAGRHALFVAVKECGLPDPLSSRTTRRAQP
jgi:hypothetical protein